ncbi:MAG: YdcH family protein [Kiloniellales bacterium]
MEEENQRPYPDDVRLSQLKREKLRIKDQIFQHGD